MNGNHGNGGGNRNKPFEKMEPFFPGQDTAVANQLNAGFGGGVEQFQGMLGDLYRPYKLMDPFKFGRTMPGQGKDEKGGLSKEEMAIAQPWINGGGAQLGRMGGQLQFDQLPRNIREEIIRQWQTGGR